LGNVAGRSPVRWRWSVCPEVFRIAAEYRILIYGIVLLLLVRFRPQGLLGPSDGAETKRARTQQSQHASLLSLRGLTRRFGGLTAVERH